MSKRLWDVMEENRVLKEQMRGLMEQVAHLEEDFARKQNELNAIHMQEIETLTSHHIAETTVLRDEREALTEELRIANAKVEDLTTKLKSSSDTATFVTRHSDGWMEAEIDEMVREFNVPRRHAKAGRFVLNHFLQNGFLPQRRKMEAEKQVITDQLLESARQRIMLQNALEQLEDEFERVKDDYIAAQLLADELRDKLSHRQSRIMSPPPQSYLSPKLKHGRSGSLASISSLVELGENSNGLEDIHL
ncbi:hypothetical protein HK104_011000 [Borealophlyctis nickersoniae]|nr:hypothetical protein HK104_011000 [Borealophlyctis nickersoniae]